MYVISKDKLPLLAAAALSGSLLLAGSAAAAPAAEPGCARAAGAEAAAICREQALMRDYALGLTSDPLVATPPVSLTGRTAEAAPAGANAPLSLLAGEHRKAAVAPRSAPAKTPPRATPKSRSFVSLGKKNTAGSKAFEAPSDGEQRRYLALGDFVLPEDASKVAQAFDLWNPRVQHVYIGGRHHSRILVGPFTDREIEAVQKHLTQHGFSSAWPLRSTANATPETLIARYPGDG